MPMIRAVRLLNAIVNGTTDGAEMQSLLSDAGRLNDWQSLLQFRGQVYRISVSVNAATAIAGSALATTSALSVPAVCDALVGNSESLVTKLIVQAAGLSPTAWSTFAGIAADATVMTAVAASSIAVGFANRSAGAMVAFAASTNAMEKLAASSAARTAIGFSGIGYSAIAASDMATGKLVLGYAGIAVTTYASFTLLAANAGHMATVCANANACTAAGGSQVAMTAVGGSNTALAAVFGNSISKAAIYDATPGVSGFLGIANARTYMKTIDSGYATNSTSHVIFSTDLTRVIVTTYGGNTPASSVVGRYSDDYISGAQGAQIDLFARITGMTMRSTNSLYAANVTLINMG